MASASVDFAYYLSVHLCCSGLLLVRATRSLCKHWQALHTCIIAVPQVLQLKSRLSKDSFTKSGSLLPLASQN